MKIAYIITGLARGGAESQLATVCNHLKDNHDVAVFSIAGNKEIIERFQGVNVHFFPLRNISNFFRLYRELSRFNPDVVHSHMIHSNIIAPIYSRLLKVPCFVTSHNINEGSPVRFSVLKLVVRLFNPHVSHVSGKGRDDYLKNGVSCNEDLYINPVALGKFSLGSTVRNEKVKWINVASLTEQKRHDRLLKVFSRYLIHYPEDELEIIGSGPNLLECNKLIQKYNIGSNVTMLGARDDINSLLGGADYFVLSSDWEGLPVSIIESLSSNVPVISTNCGDIDSVIHEGFNGFLSFKDDNSLLESMIKARALSAEEYSKVSKQCSESTERFDVNHIVNVLESLYKSRLSSL